MDKLGYYYIALAIYFALMLGIGYYAWRRTKNLDDYLLAGRDLKPGVAALSAGASDMSGWLLLGLPGAIYVSGLSEAWIAVGLTIGAYLNWQFVAPRLRSYTQVANDSITVPSFFDNRLKDPTHSVRLVSGIVILVFFTFYVSSGMVSGGKFFESSFQGDYVWGVVIVGGITVLYTLFGGFMGATFTDVAQGLLMLAALITVPIVGLTQVGGFGGMISTIEAADPQLLVWSGSFIGIVSALSWGLGYFGQPHIIVRFMALRSPRDARAGKWIGIGWMVVSVVGAIFTALVGVAYFQDNPDASLEDPETVFLVLSQIFFHPLVAGFVLAAVLAAIMSTISSQLVVCSSALVEDLYHLVVRRKLSPQQGVNLGRAGVLIVAIVAAVIAFSRNDSILDLVGFAWSGFGAAFGPIVLLSLFWRKLTWQGALAGIVLGAATVFIWAKVIEPAANIGLFEIVPGFIVCTVAAVVVSLLTFRSDPEIEKTYDDARLLAKSGAV
ncbi:sodium/proline symporter PutP [Haematomicrobium sanguinis]|uniref:sodium/proline symporter PutP n=1 Tax=Haematomicrobium sanguinis TaxID=479106 RepID=UPI0004792F23|nr:sodium/proline symporter PutP [Haematomicrobium sanguinis]